MSSGFIFDIKRFWACHNPEGQERAPDLMLREERCNLCGDCVELCAQAGGDHRPHRARGVLAGAGLGRRLPHHDFL
jgi:ferredoxin